MKLIQMIAVLLLCFSLTGCGWFGSGADDTNTGADATESTDASGDDSNETADEENKDEN